MEERVRTWSTSLLAAGLLTVGLVAVVRLVEAGDDDSVSYYRVASLVGAGAMVLIGMLLRSRHHPAVGSAILVVGAVTGIVAAMDTVVIPVLILLVVVLTLRDQTRAHL